MVFEQKYGEPIVIPCRVQYCSLTEPDTGSEFSNGKYGLWMLISKEDQATMSMVLTALADVAGVEAYTQLKKHPFMNQRKLFRDGDDVNQNPGLKDQARVGHYFCRVSTDKHFETMILQDGDFVPCNAGEIYDGCYCAVLCTPSEYREGETTLYMNAVSKVRDGQRLATRVDPMQAMRNWAGVASDETPATNLPPTAAPVAVQPPAQIQVTPNPVFANQAVVHVPEVVGQIAGLPGEVPATRPKRGRPSNADKAAETAPAVAAGTGPVVANGRTSLSDIMNK